MRIVAMALLALAGWGCGSGGGTTDPGATTVSVRFVLRTQITRRTDLTRDQETCARFVGPTHLHVGWRDFAVVNLTAVPPDRYEVTIPDVPVGRQTLQAADQNFCIFEKDGFVTRDLIANDVVLTSVLPLVNPQLPGPGLAFTVDASGRVTP